MAAAVRSKLLANSFGIFGRLFSPLGLVSFSGKHCIARGQLPAVSRRSVLSSSLVNASRSRHQTQVSVPDQQSLSLDNITKDTIDKVNTLVKSGEEGRLFAVVHVAGKQFKVTAEDVILVQGYWPPHNSDKIKLEKVMLIGGKDFTLLGRPILPQGLATVTATVIEKHLSHTNTIFYKRRRKQYMRINFFRSQLTMLRINEIKITGQVNKHQNTERYDRIFV